MKKKILKCTNGKEATCLIPEMEEDVAELERLDKVELHALAPLGAF